MNVAVFETTLDYLGIGLYRTLLGGPFLKTLAQVYVRKPSKQSELLLPTFSKLLKKTRLKPSDLDLMVTNIGPGSFTGVRMGVAAARGLAQALDIPLAGVCGLKALAKRQMPPLITGRRVIVPHLPASAREVYFAVYSEELKELTRPSWVPMAEFENIVASYKKKGMTVVEATGAPHPRVLADLGTQDYFGRKSDRQFRYDQAAPLYLQPTWAERSKK